MFPITYELPDGGHLKVTEGEIVPLGELFAHREITYYRPASDVDPAVELVFTVRDGVPMCTSVRLWSGDGDPAVRVKDLKKIPLERLVHDVFAYVGIYRPNPNEVGGYIHTRGSAELYRRDRKYVERATARRKITPDFLQRVAEVHNGAAEGSRIAAVRDEFDGVSESQAKRYIKAARERGFI